MAEMTPERSRRRGRLWAVASVVLCAVGLVLKMLGFDEFLFPISLAMLVCFLFSGLRSGWVDGYRDAETRFGHAVRCDVVAPPVFLVGQDHEHRCVHPVLDCVPERGRPEHRCHCNMRWMTRDDRA